MATKPRKQPRKRRVSAARDPVLVDLALANVVGPIIALVVVISLGSMLGSF